MPPARVGAHATASFTSICLAGERPGTCRQQRRPVRREAGSGSDDKPVALESFRGKPLIVNFWARWCAPCRVEIPELAKTQDKYARRGLTVIGIGLEDKAESVRDFMKAYEMNYTVLLAKTGGIELMQALGNTPRRPAVHRGDQSPGRDRRQQAGCDESCRPR
jgi:thiol-disulfide isomerase/thioredoxin